MTCLSLCVPTATESKNKIFTLIIMMTLASIFVGCSAESEEENNREYIKLSERVGTYKYVYDIDNGATVVLVAKNDGTGTGTGTMTLTIKEDKTDVTKPIDVPKADMESTKSYFTGGTGANQDTIQFNSATDKNSNATLVMKRIGLNSEPIPLTKELLP